MANQPFRSDLWRVQGEGNGLAIGGVAASPWFNNGLNVAALQKPAPSNHHHAFASSAPSDSKQQQQQQQSQQPQQSEDSSDDDEGEEKKTRGGKRPARGGGGDDKESGGGGGGPYYSITQLRERSVEGLDYDNREQYLTPQDFKDLFGCTKEEYDEMPKWKQQKAKRLAELF
mmetsp:Transcript_17002/g.39226  ORF Transcript_17002/g.39226 Transcript_17002/m.39226 type:complete len:172 (-) Transcript_17002:244-759(-)